MRIIKQTRDCFEGTHKGCLVVIERETGPGLWSEWYITVRTEGGCGGALYDGWAPERVRTLAEAKREALVGSRLDKLTQTGSPK